MKLAMELILMVFILALGVTEAALPTTKHKPMKVRCKNKYFPCYNQELYCPASCPRSCSVDCNNCKAVCGPVPQLPPPPKYQKQMKVVCNDKRYRTCYNKPLFCPVTCPSTCTVNCASCQPVCSAASRPKRVRCLNKKYPGCYYREFTCPAACPQTCQVDSATCSPVCNCNKPGAVCEDPRFIGADGITFYFHGKKDQDFCLITDSNLHINAHLIGKRDNNMGRDFTWVQSLGILFDNHKLYIGANNTTTWNDALDRLTLSYDNQSINLPETDGATWKSTAGAGGGASAGEVTITRSKSTNAVEIIAEGMFMIKAVVVPISERDSLVHRYGITPQDQDCFAHLDLRFKFYSLSGEVNGVLGQTYATNYVSRVKMGVANPVVGGEKEFHSSSVFATDCGVSRFYGNRNESVYDEGMDFSDLNCVSSTTGRGVVCKR
ncbi:hypothetical protein BVRB_7g176400 [Beta vulgaris subsp. vulgaris]|nr:hypothetical protein BVRB_7g176400 [Beta vulgaris subsp. vulgaris]